MSTIEKINETIQKTNEKIGKMMVNHHYEVIRECENLINLYNKLLNEPNLNKNNIQNAINETNDLIKTQQIAIKIIQNAPTVKDLN